MKSTILPERVHLGLTRTDAAYLDSMMREGGYKSRAELIRSILRAVINDDKAAHERAA